MKSPRWSSRNSFCVVFKNFLNQQTSHFLDSKKHPHPKNPVARRQAAELDPWMLFSEGSEGVTLIMAKEMGEFDGHVVHVVHIEPETHIGPFLSPAVVISLIFLSLDKNILLMLLCPKKSRIHQSIQSVFCFKMP